MCFLSSAARWNQGIFQNLFSRAMAAFLLCGADHAMYYINKPGFAHWLAPDAPKQAECPPISQESPRQLYRAGV